MQGKALQLMKKATHDNKEAAPITYAGADHVSPGSNSRARRDSRLLPTPPDHTITLVSPVDHQLAHGPQYPARG